MSGGLIYCPEVPYRTLPYHHEPLSSPQDTNELVGCRPSVSRLGTDFGCALALFGQARSDEIYMLLISKQLGRPTFWLARLYPPPHPSRKAMFLGVLRGPWVLLMRLSLEPGRFRVSVFGSCSGLWSTLNSLIVFTFARSILALWYGSGMRDRMIYPRNLVVGTCVLAL